MTHTPGPWTVDACYLPTVVTIRNAGWDAICAISETSLYAYEDDEIHSLLLANARLIAAAPDLLAACTFMLDLLENMTTEQFANGADKAARVALRAAIARVHNITKEVRL